MLCNSLVPRTPEDLIIMPDKSSFIPQIEPWIDSKELEQLCEVIQSTYITENKKTDEFLDGIRKITGSKYAIAVSNGTLALVASLLASGVKAGDEVIVPDLTFIATSNAVRMIGAHPVFCDVRRDTACLDISACASLINDKTRAIIPVHLYGQATEMEELQALSKRHGIDIIEDAAESLGVVYKGKHVGTFGRFGIFSFFANKVITCGEGGVILSKAHEDWKNLYRIKNHGRDRKGIFVHEQIGYNFCFTDLQAAVGVAQLAKYKEILRRKRRNFEQYKEQLTTLKEVKLMDVPEYVDSNYWFVNIIVDDPQPLSDYLRRHGVGSRRFFYPLHLQPCYSDMVPVSCKNSLWLYSHGLSLPSSALLTREDISRVCALIRDYYQR